MKTEIMTSLDGKSSTSSTKRKGKGMNKPYELEILVTENGSKVQKLTTKDSFNIELFTNKGLLKIDFKKWSDDND